MSENKFAGELAKGFEKELTSFLNLDWLERLEKAEQFFQNSWNTGSYEKSKKVSLMFKELTNSYKEYLEDKSEEFIEFSQSAHRTYLHHYLDMQFQYLIHRLPYYLLFAHILYDNTYHQISYETREELREICGLKHSKDRKDFFIELFSFLVTDEISTGGSEGFWNQANSLYFISWYNRFQIVIKNARKDLERQRDTPDARQTILEKYEIPQEYGDTTFIKKDFKPSELALDWALKLMKCDVKDATKALRTAREKAGKYKTNNRKKLISVYKLNLNLIITSTTLSPEARSALRFRDFRVNDRTMLYYV